MSISLFQSVDCISSLKRNICHHVSVNLTFELDTDRVKMNHRVRYLGQRSFRPWPLKWSELYMSLREKVTTLSCYNLSPVYTIQPVVTPAWQPVVSCKRRIRHTWIDFDNFGRNVTEKAVSQKMLYFPPHLTSVSALPAKQKTQKLRFYVNAECCFVSKHANTLNCHLFTAEPPFTVKMIDCMYRTRPIRREHSILQYVAVTLDV